MDDDLIHCIYASVATRKFDASHLAELLGAARANNERLGLTGMLLHSDGSFFQVLEGPQAVVDQLYGTIEADKRHAQVTKIIREPIAKRSFSSWTMGFSEVTRKEMAGLTGTNDFFGKAKCLLDLDRGRAQKVLAAFREGRWRTQLSGPRVPVGA